MMMMLFKRYVGVVMGLWCRWQLNKVRSIALAATLGSHTHCQLEHTLTTAPKKLPPASTKMGVASA